jgi:hypothetical protein
MIPLNKCMYEIAAILCGAGLVAMWGCSSDELGKRYPVSGKVTYKGQPVAKGRISFSPAPENKTGRAAYSEIEEGKYTLSTQGNNDGALPGSYRVAVTAREVDISKAQVSVAEAKPRSRAEMEKVMKHAYDRQLYVAKATQAAKDLVPKKYATPESSDLKAEVKEQTNTIDFDLTD